MVQTNVQRCAWAMKGGELDVVYHDREWGVAVHDDRVLFEFLILEGAQAGLNWSTILKKREGYRKAFDGFDAGKVAGYDAGKVAELLQNEGIIRNRLKVAAAIANAKAFLKVQEEFGSFDAYVWGFVGATAIAGSSTDANVLSKDLLKRGFKFVGPTICYAFMQAVGMVNDHEVACFRYGEV